MNRNNINKEQALQKLKHYCSYQERCHKEVKDKLYSLGLRKTEVEELISELIEQDYLNEERFAKQYAGGKFRMNSWGKIKIKHALQQKNVSTYCIDKGLKEIADEDYRSTLQKLTYSKWHSYKGEQNLSRLAKTFNYLLQKGYETHLIQEVISVIEENIKKAKAGEDHPASK